MAFREITAKRYAGFFDYAEGNVIAGTIVEENITGRTESDSETGYIAIKTTAPCACKLEDVSFESKPGDVIAISITNATRVLLGMKQETMVRATFLGFKANKKNATKRYHSWKIEVDDGQLA
jgi:hypothetical protein